MAESALAPLFDWRSAICESDLTATQRHVALTLSLHMNARGQSAMPSVNTLHEETGLARSTVKDALRVLHTRGWLEKREGAGVNGTNLYAARVPTEILERALSDRKGGEGLTSSGPTPGPPGADTRPPPAHTARAWTPVYDALLRACYGRGTSDGMTREEQRQLALAARELHEAGARPSDVIQRAAIYRKHPTYAAVALTAMSLRRHWSELAPRTNTAPPCPECGVGGGHHAIDCPTHTHKPAGPPDA